MSNEKMGRETWQEVLIRVLDTHISRHNAPNVPLELTLPYDAVVALKGLIEREYGWTEAQAEFGKGSETAFDGDRRLFEVKMTHNGRTVTISYDPSDPEAVKAAETWRKALFAPKDAPKDGNCLYVSDRVRYALDAIAYLSGNIDGRYAFIPLTDKQREAIDALYEDLHSREPFDEANLFKPGSYEPKDLPTKHNLMTELEKAAGLLRTYLKAHGDPHTSVIVTQDGATVKQDERGVKFRDDELLKRVKNAPLTADGTTATQPEPEPDVLEFDRLRDELVDPLPFDVIGLWGQVAEEFLKAHEQARAAWKEGKRARIKHSMIDALESLSKRLSADLEKAIWAKPEPAKPDKNGGEMTAAEHLKFVCNGLKAEPRRNIMDIAGSAFELRNLAKPLLAYLDKYGCDEYTGVTVTRDAVIVGKTPHTDALLFEAKFPKSENPVF